MGTKKDRKHYEKVILQSYVSGTCPECGGKINFVILPDEQWSFACPGCNWAIGGSPYLLLEVLTRTLTEDDIMKISDRFEEEGRCVDYCPELHNGRLF